MRGIERDMSAADPPRRCGIAPRKQGEHGFVFFPGSRRARGASGRGCSGGHRAPAADGARAPKIVSVHRRSSSRAPRCSLVVSHLGRGLDPICRGIDGPLPLLAPPSTSRPPTSACARLEDLARRCRRGLAWHLRTPRPAGRQQLAARGCRDRSLLRRGPAVDGAGLPAIAAQRGRRAILR